MAIGKNGAVVRQLRTLFNVGTTRELTDGQLLERFATGPGEAAELAFAALVERHGPMVLRVCRSVLTGPHDAQDAFQATFLVLVKKARGLWVRDSLGPWLHQVAYRTASCARLASSRRHRHEQGAALLRTEARVELHDNDLSRVLHEEIERLPERFRAPLVLCDLEGSSHEQAARHLGWPIGTVKSRQARGRERLRDRLRRRGVAPQSAMLATALRPDGASALISPRLVDSTIKAAIQICRGSHDHPGVDRVTCTRSSPIHVVHSIVEGGFDSLRPGRDRVRVGLLAQRERGLGRPAARGSAPLPPAPTRFRSIRLCRANSDSPWSRKAAWSRRGTKTPTAWSRGRRRSS